MYGSIHTQIPLGVCLGGYVHGGSSGGIKERRLPARITDRQNHRQYHQQAAQAQVHSASGAYLGGADIMTDTGMVHYCAQKCWRQTDFNITSLLPPAKHFFYPPLSSLQCLGLKACGTKSTISLGTSRWSYVIYCRCVSEKPAAQDRHLKQIQHLPISQYSYTHYHYK